MWLFLRLSQEEGRVSRQRNRVEQSLSESSRQEGKYPLAILTRKVGPPHDEYDTLAR
jgi:hypothetical protein